MRGWGLLCAWVALTTAACAPPMLPATLPTSASAPPPARAPEATTTAATVVAVDPIVRREESSARLGNTKLVTEIQGGSCRYGIEVPLGPGLVSVASGVWLLMPSAACAAGASPDVRAATDFILWRFERGMKAQLDPAPEHRAASLGAPIGFLSPSDGAFVARRLLTELGVKHPELTHTPEWRAAHQGLALYDDDGKAIADTGALLVLCRDDGNAEACLRAANTPNAPSRHRDLLSRACALESHNACYQLGVELRARALEALRRDPDVEAYRSFVCGTGSRANITPILVYEAAACPPPVTTPLATAPAH